MKMYITEKQLARILQHDQEIDEADSLTSPSTSNQTTSSSTSSASSSATSSAPSTTTSDIGTSPGAADYPPYPEVGHWESGIVRGPANQIDTKSNWSTVVGSKVSRGHANPLK
jgi:hypothetical protein